ncbi:MAG: hypothetical protein AAF692_01685 [Pseudomonadota bacterium]
MSRVVACDVPQDSLLARYGTPRDYRDCFYRDEPSGGPSDAPSDLPAFIERFYRSAAFWPERALLHIVTRKASSADARALARGEAESFGVWELVERKENEMLLASKGTGTASWFAIEPIETGTRLYFGSWVGNLDQSGWKALQGAHVWYSKRLLSAV